jgi:hypothetical protein
MSTFILLAIVAVAVICIVWSGRRRRVRGGPPAGDASWYPAVWDDRRPPSDDERHR